MDKVEGGFNSSKAEMYAMSVNGNEKERTDELLRIFLGGSCSCFWVKIFHNLIYCMFKTIKILNRTAAV